VASHTFRTEVRKLSTTTHVTEIAAPLLAPLVEEGWEDTDIARLAVARYVGQFAEIDTLVLGCTHYPLLESAFREVVPSGVRVLNPASEVAARFAAWRTRHPALAPAGTGRLRVLSSGDVTRFARHGARFLGEELPAVEHVGERHGRLALCPDEAEPTGQIVRE
jgi:glutamate racemase